MTAAGRVVRADSLPGKPGTIVDLRRTGVADAALAPLAAMTDLVVVDRNDTKATDAGLKHVAGRPARPDQRGTVEYEDDSGVRRDLAADAPERPCDR